MAQSLRYIVDNYYSRATSLLHRLFARVLQMRKLMAGHDLIDLWVGLPHYWTGFCALLTTWSYCE